MTGNTVIDALFFAVKKIKSIKNKNKKLFEKNYSKQNKDICFSNWT